jgi:hypothetical protein
MNAEDRNWKLAQALEQEYARDIESDSKAAYEQGQRDREQGYPYFADRWGLVGPPADAYQRGFDNPRPGTES